MKHLTVVFEMGDDPIDLGALNSSKVVFQATTADRPALETHPGRGGQYTYLVLEKPPKRIRVRTPKA